MTSTHPWTPHSPRPSLTAQTYTQARPLLLGIRTYLFHNRVHVYGTHMPHRANAVNLYQGTERSQASAMSVLLLSPTTVSYMSFTCRIESYDPMCNIRPGLLCHCLGLAKGPPHHTQSESLAHTHTPPPGDVPTSRKHAQVYMFCTDMEGEEETSRS